MTRRRVLNPAQEAEVVRRYQAGRDGTGPRETYVSLAEEFGVSVQPIYRLVSPSKRPTSAGGPAKQAAANADTNTPLPHEPEPESEVSPEAFDTGALVRDLVDAGGLHEFIRIMWSTCVPQDFVDNWHIGAICEYLEAVTVGQVDRLVINQPPGTMKSLSVGVFWPAWVWTLDPACAFLFGSFDKSLLNNKQSEPMIELLRSDIYQQAYGKTVKLTARNPALGEFKNTAGGFRFNTSPEGRGTGRHVDHLVVDDPMKPQDAISGRKAAFERVNNWFDGTLPSRVRKAIVLIMQRVHTDDLAGICLERGYTSLILPMRMTKRAMWARDPRTELGELLWPSNPRFTEEKVRELEVGLRHEGASAQLQQNPTPSTGGLVEEPWTRLEWVEPPTRGRWCSSWDFSTKSAQTSHSKVAGQLWCATRDLSQVREYLSELDDRLAKIPGSHGDVRFKSVVVGETYYLLVDWVGGHWNYVQSKAQFEKAHKRPLWRHARIKLIEEKANGIPLINEFRSKFVGITGVEPEGDKDQRLRVHSEKFKLNQIIFCPGADPVREELVKYPRFSWDDQMDACTQALDYLANKNARYRDGLRKAAARGFGRI